MNQTLALDLLKEVVDEFGDAYAAMDLPAGGIRITMSINHEQVEHNYVRPYTTPDGREVLRVSSQSKGDESSAICSMRNMADVITYAQTLISRYNIRTARPL